MGRCLHIEHTADTRANYIADPDRENAKMKNTEFSNVTQCRTFVIGRNLHMKKRSTIGFADVLKKYVFTTHHLRKIRARYMCATRGLEIVVYTAAKT